MSTFSDAWQTTPPAVRDFYVHYHRRYLAHSWKAEWSDVLQAWIPFTMIGWSFQGWPGFALAQANWLYQIWATGSFNPAIVYFSLAPWFPPPDIQPVGPGMLPGSYADQFVQVPNWAWNYPRAKYKVRRSYWTGKPRHRRNI